MYFQIKENEPDLEAELLITNLVPAPHAGVNQRDFYKCNKKC